MVGTIEMKTKYNGKEKERNVPKVQQTQNTYNITYTKRQKKRKTKNETKQRYKNK